MTAAADAAEGLALRLDRRFVALANAVAIALLGVLGVLYITSSSRFAIFDLDGERNVPAVYSAALWAALALLAALLGRRAGPTWWALSGPLLLVSADEFAEIHERLERITGIDWQILYSPFGLLAAVLWVLIGRRLRELPASFALFCAGTVCGVVSQVLEAVEYGPHDRRVAHFNALMVPEELLEMAAAVLIGLALIGMLRAVHGRVRA